MKDEPAKDAGDQAEAKLTEAKQTGVKDEPAKDTRHLWL